MARFEKGSRVLLPLLSCFVSWCKTTALLILFFQGWRKKGWLKRGLGEGEERRDQGPEAGPVASVMPGTLPSEAHRSLRQDGILWSNFWRCPSQPQAAYNREVT